MEQTKTCKTCQEMKPLEIFSSKQWTRKGCRNKKKREQYKTAEERSQRVVNYKIYEGGKAIPTKFILNNEQFNEFRKRNKTGLYTHREALKIMNLI